MGVRTSDSLQKCHKYYSLIHRWSILYSSCEVEFRECGNLKTYKSVFGANIRKYELELVKSSDSELALI